MPKKKKHLCSFSLENYYPEDMILIEKDTGVPYRTMVHKDYKDDLPSQWKYIRPLKETKKRKTKSKKSK